MLFVLDANPQFGRKDINPILINVSDSMLIAWLDGKSEMDYFFRKDKIKQRVREKLHERSFVIGLCSSAD